MTEQTKAGLEVVAWMNAAGDMSYIYTPSDIPLVRQSDAAAIIAGNDAEIERLRGFESAFNEWIEKSEWVQENRDGLFDRMLGMHRADCMRSVIDRLRAEVERLTKERDDWQCQVGNILATIPLGDVLRVSGTIRDAVEYFKRLHATIAQQAEKIQQVRSSWANSIDEVQRLRKRNTDLVAVTTPENRALISEVEILRQSSQRKTERIAELEAQNEELCRKYQEHAGAKYALQDTIAAQDAALEKAREALERLGAHDQNCGVFDLDDDDRHKPCTCGFTEALAAIDALGQPEGDKGGAE